MPGRSLKHEQDPMGLLGTKAFLCKPSLSSKGSRFKHANQGMKRQGKSSPRNNSATLGQGPSSPSRDTHNVSLSLFNQNKNPHQMEDVNHLMKPSSFQRRSQLILHYWMVGTEEYGPLRTLILVCQPLDYKTPHKPPGVGDT